MDPQISALLEAVRRFREVGREPDDIQTFLEDLPPVGTLPSPWLTWTLFGLARHRERQQWVEDIVRHRLSGDPATVARMGAFGHPERSQSGPVPGMPEWEYYFHGIGCCLTHKVDGHSIDVDFFDDSSAYFSTYFYTVYLESLRRPVAPEDRLLELHPSASTVEIPIDELLGMGGLTPFPNKEKHPFRLSDAVSESANDIARFCEAWAANQNRMVLAGIIGDWLAVEGAFKAARSDCPSFVSNRARASEAAWAQQLKSLLPTDNGRLALQGLADMRSPDLTQHLTAALRNLNTAITAMGILTELDDPSWCEQVWALLHHVYPDGAGVNPSTRIQAIKFLIRHKYRLREALPLLKETTDSEIGEAVLLALEHSPEYVVPLVRDALCSSVPICRTTVAAILALIDAPWSRRELFNALNSSDDQEITADVRAALLELNNRKADAAVLRWEELNPHEKEVGSYIEVEGRTLGPFYSLTELMLENRVHRLRHEMQELHGRVIDLRHVVPPDVD